MYSMWCGVNQTISMIERMMREVMVAIRVQGKCARVAITLRRNV